MRRLKMTGRIDPGAVAASLAVTLPVIVTLGALAGYGLRGLPVLLLVTGIGWLAAIILGMVYELVTSLKVRRLQPIPARARRARR